LRLHHVHELPWYTQENQNIIMKPHCLFRQWTVNCHCQNDRFLYNNILLQWVEIEALVSD